MLQNFQTYVNPTYDRRARKWQSPNGGSFPAGQQGHNAARLAAIAEASPELADKIVGLGTDSALFKRLLDAGELVLAGAVYADYVQSQNDENQFYHIGYAFGSYTCSCDAFKYRPVRLEGYGEVCKHSLAHHIAYLIGIEFEAAPIPFQGEPVDFDFEDIDIF